ncbi:hypothetical protein STIAU_4763 [Stigmatella aurantiaca DW4/3-1]|uniref:Uncharacterized protein n=1 Tax=Stigmatella aurantiaca (strain DW4/3-1) TaxID=378806 RepID=Q08TN9_STIAD|nr:hypothetical protein STIAU_4763 [Stigmatella aurantiaca DW4/3-1]
MRTPAPARPPTVPSARSPIHGRRRRRRRATVPTERAAPIRGLGRIAALGATAEPALAVRIGAARRLARVDAAQRIALKRLSTGRPGAVAHAHLLSAHIAAGGPGRAVTSVRGAGPGADALGIGADEEAALPRTTRIGVVARIADRLARLLVLDADAVTHTADERRASRRVAVRIRVALGHAGIAFGQRRTGVALSAAPREGIAALEAPVVVPQFRAHRARRTHRRARARDTRLLAVASHPCGPRGGQRRGLLADAPGRATLDRVLAGIAHRGDELVGNGQASARGTGHGGGGPTEEGIGALPIRVPDAPLRAVLRRGAIRLPARDTGEPTRARVGRGARRAHRAILRIERADAVRVIHVERAAVAAHGELRVHHRGQGVGVVVKPQAVPHFVGQGRLQIDEALVRRRVRQRGPLVIHRVDEDVALVEVARVGERQGDRRQVPVVEGRVVVGIRGLSDPHGAHVERVVRVPHVVGVDARVGVAPAHVLEVRIGALHGFPRLEGSVGGLLHFGECNPRGRAGAGIQVVAERIVPRVKHLVVQELVGIRRVREGHHQHRQSCAPVPSTVHRLPLFCDAGGEPARRISSMTAERGRVTGPPFICAGICTCRCPSSPAVTTLLPAPRPTSPQSVTAFGSGQRRKNSAVSPSVRVASPARRDSQGPLRPPSCTTSSARGPLPWYSSSTSTWVTVVICRTFPWGTRTCERITRASTTRSACRANSSSVRGAAVVASTTPGRHNVTNSPHGRRTFMRAPLYP